jgi:tetratricopeptide (TPR) repeat protein
MTNSRFKKEADLGIADTYLLAGKFQKAQELYEQLIVSDTANRQKPAIFYRLSQIEYKRGNRQKANEYWLKLKTDFPLSPELRSTGGIWLPNVSVKDPGVCSISSPGLYSIQLGFFTNSANANNLKNRLLNRNYPAYLESSADGYRVKVGRFKSEKEALDLESKLSREGFNTKICP